MEAQEHITQSRLDVVQEHENCLELQKTIADSADKNYEDSSTPVPIVATTRAPESDSNQDEKGHLVPIHTYFKDNFTQGEYDAYEGGSALNW